jgi:hypothetical protein
MAFEEVKNGKVRGPVPVAPRVATLGDFLSNDVFSQLRASEETEKDKGETWEEILDGLDAG